MAVVEGKVMERPRMDVDSYEVIPAKDAVEAMQKSRWQIGDLAKVSHVTAIANGNGTFSVFPAFQGPLTPEERIASCPLSISTS